MPLIVNKSDGSTEVYLHTKVMGTIAAALSDCDCYQENLTEQLTEAVTIYLSRRQRRCNNCGTVNTDEILSMVKVVLCDTGYPQAALTLQEHYLNRQIKRTRIRLLTDSRD